MQMNDLDARYGVSQQAASAVQVSVTTHEILICMHDISAFNADPMDHLQPLHVKVRTRQGSMAAAAERFPTSGRLQAARQASMAASKSLASSLGQAHARAMQNERVRSHAPEPVPGKPTQACWAILAIVLQVRIMPCCAVLLQRVMMKLGAGCISRDAA